MLANLTRFKDHDTLLKAFSEARRLRPALDLHLVLAGRQEETTQAIKATAWDLQLAGKLHLTGSISSVDALLRSANLVVHSSRTEGCPNAALEAMALGLPVIGTNIPGMRQALGEDAAAECLTEPGDWHELALRIVERAESRRLCSIEGERNRHRICRSFSIGEMAYRSLSVIRSAAEA
jgi:glycosyltransferase involved in cell wall biosynthesis